MIYLVKTKSGKFQVVMTGTNGEPLNDSETENSRQSIVKNVTAVAKQIKTSDGDGKSAYIEVQDQIKKGRTPQLFFVYADGEWELNGDSPYPLYVAGKNPSPKKKK